MLVLVMPAEVPGRHMLKLADYSVLLQGSDCAHSPVVDDFVQCCDNNGFLKLNATITKDMCVHFRRKACTHSDSH